MRCGRKLAESAKSPYFISVFKLFLGKLQYHSERLDEGRQTLEEVAALGPEIVLTKLQYDFSAGELQRRQGETAKALQYFKSAVQLVEEEMQICADALAAEKNHSGTKISKKSVPGRLW